ncbi:Uncharacterized protein QTN25_002205 [Entamoeba marina]
MLFSLLLLLVAVNASNFFPFNDQLNEETKHDVFDDKIKSLAYKFKGTHGTLNEDSISYEYSVLSYMSGQFKSYISTIKTSDGRIGHGRGTSAIAAHLQALNNLK